jgi:hypothetical protein
LGGKKDARPGIESLVRRREADSLRDRRSLLGLDEEQSFLHKLGQFLSALCLGPLVGLLLLVGVDRLEKPWRVIAQHLCETLGLFWALLLIFIWWRPSWFRRLYLSAEQKAILVVRLVGLACLFVIGAAMLIEWLRGMRII